ncbi:MAG: anaerobic ribonucleoside-triphosphate reductase activating protein [Lachnospiraceae bacterium]|nr:anaerobic ribonucleoside-triphosphate reductase activating protein [Lachnospiraceae bacterium]
MQIYGIQKTTLLDYPGKVAATIFTPGCNFRCPYCYNMRLAESDINAGNLDEDEVFAFLTKRKGVLDGICISGGEPTLQKDLIPFIQKAKGLGYLIKLDTNGTNPDIIKELIEKGLIDHIAMDIKSSLSGYPEVSGVKHPDTDAVKKSVLLLMEKRIPFEFRTTVVREYHNAKVFDEIGGLLRGADPYYLQSFEDSEAVTDHSLSSYTKEELQAFVCQLSEYDINAVIRGQ